MVKQNEAVPSHPDESFPTPAARAFAIPEVSITKNSLLILIEFKSYWYFRKK